MFKQLIVFMLLTIAATACASHVVVTAPNPAIVDSSAPQVISLGVIGPGQNVAVSIDRGTNEQSKDASNLGSEAIWDKLAVVQSSLPAGWQSIDSLTYETPLTARIIAASDAADGEYSIQLQTVDEYEGVASLAFSARVTVSRNVMTASLNPPVINTGIGQPAVYSFTLTSTSSANDAFEISTSGLPYEWAFTKTVFLPRGSTKTVPYEIIGSTQKDLPVKFTVRSLSSPLIQQQLNARLITTSSLLQDAKAASLGIPLFPNSEQAIYSIIGFLANVIWV
ncbi:hypothetical protein AUJ65_05090 [Candidatus Micrarchaeota archaeon CG1_02_51_15]|nr:MAG: hypothetical protein AUJ65_05090 [Candidatus Micrarchaeota archaeon CG1_02_51_15]